jgi:hypothetical protein
MIRFELTDNEQKVLQTLEKRGAMSPSQVSAETWLLPGETNKVLKNLSGVGMVVLRNDSNSPDGQMVAITGEARTFLKGNRI